MGSQPTTPDAPGGRCDPPVAVPAGVEGAAGSPSDLAPRILRNSAWNLTSQGVYAVLYLIIIRLLAGSLSKEDFGQYFTLFALILGVQLVVEAGLGTVLTYRIAQAPARWRENVAEAGALLTIIAPASFVVFLGLGCVWSGGEHLLAFVLAGIACAALQVQRYCVGVLHAFESFNHDNAARLLQVGLFALLAGTLVVLGKPDVTRTVALLAASHGVAAVFLLASLHRRYRCLGWRWPGARAKTWLAEAVPLGLGDVTRGLTWQLDTVLLGVLRPATEVAIYSVAYRPLGPLNWVPRALLTAAFPSLARLAQGGTAGLQRAYVISLRLLWIISLPIAVVFCVCAEPIIVVLAGRAYLDAALPMRLLIWITGLSFLSAPFRYVFAAVGRSRLYSGLVLGIFVLELVLELALIPHWGYLGACAGSIVGELGFTALGLVLCRAMGLGSPEWGAMLRALLPAALLAMGLWSVRSISEAWLAVAAVAGTGLYFLLCLWLRVLRPEEARQLQEMVLGSRPSQSQDLPAPVSPIRKGSLSLAAFEVVNRAVSTARRWAVTGAVVVGLIGAIIGTVLGIWGAIYRGAIADALLIGVFGTIVLALGGALHGAVVGALLGGISGAVVGAFRTPQPREREPSMTVPNPATQACGASDGNHGPLLAPQASLLPKQAP